MRVLVCGDTGWRCLELAGAILRRLADRVGPDLTIVVGNGPGVDASILAACRVLGVQVEAHKPVKALGKQARASLNAELVGSGVQMCVAIHRFIMNSTVTKDCVRKALQANIATYLIDSPEAVPRRLRLRDRRLAEVP
jgi:hypothetical protein